MGSDKYEKQDEVTLEQLFENMEAHLGGLEEAIKEMQETYDSIQKKRKEVKAA